MCVIMLVADVRPTERMVDLAFDRNPDMGGVAWREGGKVRWRKGLNREQMQEAAKDLPMPFVMHFRKKSIGEAVAELCHPFPVSEDASVELEGETDGDVWFHNGTWHKWDEGLIDAALKSKSKLPLGRWNDSRAMAWLAGVAGPGVLEILEAKGILYGPKKSLIFWGKPHTETEKWKKEEGIWMSNTEHMPKFQTNVTTTRNVQEYPKSTPSTPVKAVDKGPVSRFYCAGDKCLNRGQLDINGLCPVCASKEKKSSVTQSSSAGQSSLRPSPFESNVERVREVARTEGPFQAKKLLTELESELPNPKTGKGISTSQAKKLRRELDNMSWAVSRVIKPKTSPMFLPGD